MALSGTWFVCLFFLWNGASFLNFIIILSSRRYSLHTVSTNTVWQIILNWYQTNKRFLASLIPFVTRNSYSVFVFYTNSLSIIDYYFRLKHFLGFLQISNNILQKALQIFSFFFISKTLIAVQGPVERIWT